MSGHTKGPWKAGLGDSTETCLIVSQGYTIATVWGGWADYEHNARLIAAAPCMRNALTEARTTLAMLKRNVVTEIARHDGLLRWEGVPEAIQARIDECDAAITRTDGGGA